MFGKHIFMEWKFWNEIFNKWLTYSGDNLKVAFNMVLSFYEFMSVYDPPIKDKAAYDEALNVNVTI